MIIIIRDNNIVQKDKIVVLNKYFLDNNNIFVKTVKKKICNNKKIANNKIFRSFVYAI